MREGAPISYQPRPEATYRPAAGLGGGVAATLAPIARYRSSCSRMACETESVCVCVWVREREKERERVCVCVRERVCASLPEGECVCISSRRRYPPSRGTDPAAGGWPEGGTRGASTTHSPNAVNVDDSVHPGGGNTQLVKSELNINHLDRHYSCRANMTHKRQPRPDSGLGFQVEGVAATLSPHVCVCV